MDPCKKLEPRVIDHVMIEQCLEEQGLKGEAGRLARLEGIPWDEVKHIRLEYMSIILISFIHLKINMTAPHFPDIIRIDHLWVLPALTRLSINNNLIEKIENLETLVNLKYLDLSFNKIKNIENLEALVKLETLTLYSNLITEIENLDTLTNLMIFSIGNNKIEDRNNVLYLRQFSNLKSVNMAGNPCAQDPDFRLFIAAFLPKIVYYEYVMIQDEEREEGMQIHVSQLHELEKIEDKEKLIQDKIAAEEAESELHAESFVEFLGSNHLFQQMFEKDADCKTLLKIGDEAQDNQAEFEEEFNALCRQVFEIGQEQYILRKNEVDHFLSSVEGAKLKAQQEGIEQVDKFLVKKTEMFNVIKELQVLVENRELNLDDYNQKIFEHAVIYNDLIHQTWKLLMGLEITLYEQVIEVNETFEHALTEMVNTFIESAQAVFAQMRAREQAYMEVLNDAAVRYMTMASLQPDFIMPKELRPLMVEKEILVNALAMSHDLHLQAIDNREDRLVNRAKTWLNNLVSNLQRDETKRNRSNILEINHYLDIQREEFDDLANFHRGTGMDLDISAALS